MIISETMTRTLSPVETGRYTDRDTVAQYLHRYRHLPENYITKTQAFRQGLRRRRRGTLPIDARHNMIGGGPFRNDVGLPDGYDYRECDVNNLGASRRGLERLIWSDDGAVYYTADHYQTFIKLY